MFEYNSFELDNGLRVVHFYDDTTAMAALNVVYNVGARDEDASMTGLAHLFEHLMFGGSKNVADFDDAIEKAGGINNAWTSNDFTSFYDAVPAVNAETMFWLESDRMLSPLLTSKSLDVQRQVVIEEFKQTCLNEPYGDMGHHLRAMLYKSHPYRIPVIGLEPSHIEKASLKTVKDFFYSHYAPNNAVVAVGGNITAETTRSLAEKWFGDIPHRDIAPRCYSPEPPMPSVERKVVNGRVSQTEIVLAYRMGSYASEDYPICDIMTDILASGRSSRMFRELVMDGRLFSEADASIIGSEEPGFLMLSGKLLTESDEAVAEGIKLLEHQAKKIIEEGVGTREVERSINRMESEATFRRMSFLKRTRELAMAAIRGESPDSLVARYKTVTPDDIQRVAKRIFQAPGHAELVYRPTEKQD